MWLSVQQLGILRRMMSSFLRVYPWDKFYRRAMRKVPIYPRDFGRSTNPYPRWIKQGTSGGPGTYEGGNYPVWDYQPLTRRGARPRTRPNHPRERVTASVRALNYHGKHTIENERNLFYYWESLPKSCASPRVHSELFRHLCHGAKCTSIQSVMYASQKSSRSTPLFINFLMLVSGLKKNHDFFQKNKKIGFFKFKSDFFKFIWHYRRALRTRYVVSFNYTWINAIYITLLLLHFINSSVHNCQNMQW